MSLKRYCNTSVFWYFTLNFHCATLKQGISILLLTERKKMARSIDSDYIDFSHMGGFNMGIDFDGFEENVRKFMEVVVVPSPKFDVKHDFL
jgi:hypothetical protein